MSKLAALVLLPALGACTTDTTPSPLAELTTAATVQLAPDGIHIVIAENVGRDPQPEDCVVLGDDVTVTLDGVPLDVMRGKWSEGFFSDASCEAPRADLVGDIDPTQETATVVIADHSATWTIEVPRPFATNFTLGHGPYYGTLTWRDAKDGFQADLVRRDADGKQLSTQSITTKTSSADVDWPGAASIEIDATRPVTAQRCDGLLECDVSARVKTTLAIPE